jgi:hypothetical protein
VGGDMNLVSAMLKQMDGEKGGAKVYTIYTRIKKIIKVESPLNIRIIVTIKYEMI